MKKVLIVATAAAVIAGSALTYHAYARHDGQPPWRWNMSAADMAAFADARIAALKAGLALTPEQEKLWPPVESSLREMAKQRIERRQQLRAEREAGSRPTDPIVRLRRGAELLTQRGEQLKRLADASQPLYDSLDEAQKRRLQLMLRRGEHRMRERGWRRFGDSGDWHRRHSGWERDWREEREWRRGRRETPVESERL